MDYDDRFHPAMKNDYVFDEDMDNNEKLTEVEKMDKGLNFIKIRCKNRKNILKHKRIKVYTSAYSGLIRDAETGEYYNYKVGSKDEDLFFKVTIATGECTSANRSTTAFYTSPYQYMNHMKPTIEARQNAQWAVQIALWENKRDDRLYEIENRKNKQTVYVN